MKRPVLALLCLALALAGCRRVAGYGEGKDPDEGVVPLVDGGPPPDVRRPEDGPASDLPTAPCPRWPGGLCPTPHTLALGVSYSCLLAQSGQVTCWGENAGEVFGLEADDSALPQKVDDVTLALNAKDSPHETIAAGGAHVCGIDGLGRVICWGFNGSGQVDPANSAMIAKPRPVALPGQTALSVAAGLRHTCVLTTGGDVVCWGANDRYQRGTWSSEELVKISFPNTKGKAKALSCGIEHCCAALEDKSTGIADTVACWGANDLLQLNNNNGLADSATPLTSNPGLSPISRLSCGGNFCCAMGSATGNQIYCWGDNMVGQLGIEVSAPRTTIRPKVDNTGVVEVHAGGAHACVRRQSGAISCWGFNRYDQIRAPVTDDYGEVHDLTERFDSIALGLHHSCGIRGSEIHCWGRNQAGQLGNGAAHRRATPEVLKGSSGNSLLFDDLATGGYHSCAVDSSKALHCWGYNRYLQAHDAKRSWSVPSPTQITAAQNTAHLALGALHGCYRDSQADEYYCWGASWDGQTTTTPDYTGPVLGNGKVKKPLAFAAGHDHTCALDKDGYIWCWGSNYHGQLGKTPARSPQAEPSRIDILADGNKALAARFHASCAIRGDDTLVCWGDESELQIGAKSAGTSFSYPTSNEKLQAVTLGGRHGCALKKDGKVICWGDESDGRLGVPSPSATGYNEVMTLTNIKAISAGWRFTCALDSDGKVSCWGGNGHHELGPKAKRSTYQPTHVPLPTGTVATKIAAGWNHVCALLDDKRIVCWGSTGLGQLGSGMPERKVHRILP